MPSDRLRRRRLGRTSTGLRVLFIGILLASPSAALAQRFTAEVSGTVVDEAGGVVPGADVTLTNQASGSERHSVSNEDGVFAFSAVPAATYTVTVALQGFSTFEYTDIVLRAGDSRTLRQIPLEVAGRAETVSVSALVEMTPLDSGEKSTTLDANFIEEVPIVGTNVTELLRILPGMAPMTGGPSGQPNYTGEVIGINGSGEGSSTQSAVGSYIPNGSSPFSLDITIDGAPGADPGCNCATSVNPNTEMVQEFKVLQASFGAEHAKGPSSISVVSKSGGRDFHGSAFLYFRDYRLNSNDWFVNKVGDDRPESRYLYPGFTLSGPLSFGSFNKGRDKLFFFVGYEYYDQRLDTGINRSWVPTAEMRHGDFTNAEEVGSGTFVNTVPTVDGETTLIIPEGQIDPGGRVLLDRFPLPNADPATSGGYNHVDTLVTSQPNHQLLARLDWNLSAATKAFVRYNLQRETQPFAYGLWWGNSGGTIPYPSRVAGDNRSDSISASLTHVFNPTLTSETIVAYTYIDFQNALADPSQVSRQELGYPYQGVFGEHGDVIPNVDASPFTFNGPNWYNFGGFDPVLFATKKQWAVTQNLTKVWGTHTAKFGFFWERIVNTQPGSLENQGFIELAPWTASSTGNTFADLLLGRITWNYQESTTNVLHDVGWNRWELFGQDSWKMSPRVTLNLGARVSLFGAVEDLQGNGIAVWDESRYESDLATGVEFPGVTWNARDPSVPVGGVGSRWAIQPRVGFAWDLFGRGETVLRGGAGLYLFRDPTGWTGDLLDLGAGVRQWSGEGRSLSELEGLEGDDLAFGGAALDIGDDRTPRAWSWSLTLDQRLPWSLNLELGYVGNYGDQYSNNSDAANRNAVPLGAMLEDPFGNPDAYRPLDAYGNLYILRHSFFQHYHGLQALLARQRGDFNFTLAYTFSKVLGIRPFIVSGSEYDLTPFRDFNYSPLSDRTHVATGTFSWLLPDPGAEGALGQLLGGWQLAGIVNYVSGPPLPFWGYSNSFNIQGTSADGYPLNQRTFFSGSPDVPVTPVLTCDPRDNVPDGYLINPDCFAAPTRGQNGNYNLPYMKAQPYWNVDLSVFKNFPLGGDRQLQLRVSAYNVLNHPIAFPDPTRNLTLSFDQGVLSDPGFGWLPTGDDPVRGDANKAGRRIVQLAVRLIF